MIRCTPGITVTALAALALSVSAFAAVGPPSAVSAAANAPAVVALDAPVPVTEAAFFAMEQGTIASASGTEGSNSTRIRLQAPAAISSAWQWLQFDGGVDLDITVFAYNATGAYLSPSTGWQSLASGPYTYAVPAGAASIAYVLRYRTETPIGPGDRDPWLQISVVTPVSAPDDSHVFPYADTGMRLVNHRGLSPGYPENTLVALSNAVAREVFAIEIDLRPTADGQIIVLHDSSVDRTTDGTGEASSLTLAQIKTLDAGSYAGPQFVGERIPTFEETLELVKGSGVKLLLDIKVDSVVEQVVHLTEAHEMVDQVIVGPRSLQALNDFKTMNPDLFSLGFIGSTADIGPFVAAGVDVIRLTPEWIAADVDNPLCRADYAARIGAYDAGERAHPGAKSCQIERLAEVGVPVWTTTYGAGYADMDIVLRSGSVGLLSDVPDVLAQLLEDVDTARRTEAGQRLTALAPAAAALTSGSAPVTAALQSATDHLASLQVPAACPALDGALDALIQSGSPTSETAPVKRDIDRTKAVLACSRFAFVDPPVDVPEVPFVALTSLMGLATIAGYVTLTNRRRRLVAI